MSYRTRANVIKVHLTDNELFNLNSKVNGLGIPREVYIRSIINGYIPSGKPHPDYLFMIRELRRIGNNLNQIAIIAHKKGVINSPLYIKEVSELKRVILEIQTENSKVKIIDYK